MAAISLIQWTDATLNPTLGCTKVGTECANCYAPQPVPDGPQPEPDDRRQL